MSPLFAIALRNILRHRRRTLITVAALVVGVGVVVSMQGLLNALHEFRGERVSDGQLAEEASYIEIDVLKRPIGKQDHYAAAFGGLNFFCFMPGGRVTVEHQRLPEGAVQGLFDHLLMFWTRIRRDASSVLDEQQRRTVQNLELLRAMREDARRLQHLMRNGFEPLEFGRILDATWALKRQLARGITNDQIDAWYQRALDAGAVGGKICGAGGGGFLLLIMPSERREAVRQALGEMDEVRIRYEAKGSSVLFSYGA
jgi:D-glycero-alpha-D-manno-heptose-7-phosphate kinase